MQHRRTQNRLAQRAYRQRRDEERKKLLDEVRAWKDKCKELEETCKKLNSALHTAMKSLDRMEGDKEALHTAFPSVNWLGVPL